VHIEERLEFQKIRGKAVGVPESKTEGDSHYAVSQGRIPVSMVSIVPVCCISWLNKVSNSARKAETWGPGATTWQYEAEGGLGSGKRG